LPTVNDAPLPQPPAWVSKRDGRLVPFEADRISRSLFAATETLGRPDAFLARELADGVVHFLAADGEDTPPTTAQIAETVVKVVRELGQPALAEAYAARASHRRRRDPATANAAGDHAGSPPEVILRFAPGTPLAEVLAGCCRDYALQAIFTRDLAAAQSAGLLTLTGLNEPDELAGSILPLPPRAGTPLAAAVEEVRHLAGHFIVVDSPEHLLADSDGPRAASDWAAQLLLGLRLGGLEAVVNLNAAVPPPWAGHLAQGPLFTARRRQPSADPLPTMAERLAEALLAGGSVRVDWHLAGRDFATAGRERLLRLARRALDGGAVGFVFDRPRRAVPLAEGVDRQHPAVLLTIGLHLARLAEQPGAGADLEAFLRKLGSLARLALSAAAQKREYLRRLDRARHARGPDDPAVTSGFLLDRARLIAAPVGLDAVVRRFSGRGLCGGGDALEIGRQVVQRLREALAHDGRPLHLETCVDGPWSFRADAGGGWPGEVEAAGPTPWDANALPHAQLRAAGVLHAAVDAGTLALLLPQQPAPAPEKVVDWLRTAWQQTEVVRVHLVRAGPTHRQLSFFGGEVGP
jgi:hypothetical protein